MLAFSLALPRVSPLAARPARQFSIAAFAVEVFGVLLYEAKRFALAKRLFSRKVRIALRSVTFTPTHRRSLISPLQGIINTLFNGQLVPQFLSKNRKTKKETPLGISFFVVRSTGIEPRSKILNPFIFKAFRLSVPEKSPK